MKMTMYLKYRDGRPKEKWEHNTKAECDTHFDYILKYRRHEIEAVWIGPTNRWDLSERINLNYRGPAAQKE